MEILLQAMIFVMGCSLGSFVNMLLYRSAVGEDKQKNKVLKKVSKDGKESRSFCDFCGRQLRWYENIPVISWAVQSGKTKCCGKPLPYSYPAVELVTGILILINFRFQFLGPEVFSNWQFWVALAAETVIITMLVFEAYFDLTYMLLPDFSSIILWLCSLILWGLKVFGSGHIIFENWIAMAMAGGFLLTLHLITRGKGMGMGDVIYALFMGFLLGYEKLVVAFYIAFIGGAIVGLILMLLRKVNKKQPIPFGPFLIAGTIIAWWFGEKIWILVTGMIL